MWMQSVETREQVEENIQASVHRATSSWNPYARLQDNEGREAELRGLESYLKYLALVAAFEERVAKQLEDARNSFIKNAMEQYDSLQRCLEEEENMWGWSPLFQALMRDPVASGPQRPWEHTEVELEEVIRVMREEVGDSRSSLESECPHVVRALKLYSRLSYSRDFPLAHPIRGMTRAKLLEIAVDQRESQRLCVCAQDLEDIGFTYFPCTFGRTQEPLHSASSDTVALMGLEGAHQEEVIRKIEAFLKRVLRRAIVDLHRISEHKDELAGLWCNTAHQNLSPNFRVKCDEVRILASQNFKHVGFYMLHPETCVVQMCSADVELVCLNSRDGCWGCIGCCQVFAKVLVVRENIDIGWAMMGSKNHASEDLRPYVEKVVDALTELHGKEQAMAFRMLGYPAVNKVPPTHTGSVANLDHLDIPQLEQIVGSEGDESDRDGAPLKDVTDTDVVHGRVSNLLDTSSR